MGCTPLLQHAIETKGPPLHQKYRQQNPAVRQEEMALVQQMLSSGVIHPSNSPWALPVVMVKKKYGSLRFCVDFRQLNAVTVKDAHPILRIDDLLDALHGARWFSTLDLKNRYWQVPIQEWDKEKMAFAPAAANCSNLTRFPLASATLPPPSPDSWTASSPVSTGKPASSTWTTSSSLLLPGRSTSTASAKSSSVSDARNSSSVPTNVPLQPGRSATSAIESPKKASYPIPLC